MISVENIVKSFEDQSRRTTVLRDVSFHVNRSEIFTLLGPSGSGKTTSMRCVAGLETPDSGRIALDGDAVFCSRSLVNTPPNKRGLGMVFQSYAIWPHMSVGENVAYPLSRRRFSRDEIKAKVRRALAQVDLLALADRPAPNLSGGQQQRVALARAIVNDPAILILDEPLSNLDAKLRLQMRAELVELQRKLGLTMLYVTHDQEEALSMSSTLAVMRDGEVVETGDPITLFEAPKTHFTAEFLGLSNFLPGQILDGGGGSDSIAIDTEFGRFAGNRRKGETAAPELFFRPHHACLDASNEDGLNIGRARLVAKTFLGELMEITLQGKENSVKLRVHPSSEIQMGEMVSFRVEPRHSLIFSS